MTRAAKRTSPTGLRIGVTLHLREGFQSIWENGIFQNCLFLVQLLQQSPVVEKAVLVCGGEGKIAHDALMLAGTGVVLLDIDQAMGDLDIVIEMSSQLDEQWVKAFKAAGGRYVWMRVGNDYVIDIERALFNKPHGGLASNKPYDAIWTIPEYERSCRDYFSLMARAPLSIVPHIWTPYFLDKSIAALPHGLQWGYRPGREHWRVCIFEPNISMVKTSFVPMLACEVAYRARPGLFEALRVCNTLHVKDHLKFVNFARQLDLVNHGLATFEGRFPLAEFMAAHGDCIVSHHWENGQNYLYYEALYGGYPLVHNSEFIREAGYYYADFDCADGGRMLLHAFERHDASLDAYRQRAHALIESLDVAWPANVDAYTRELVKLYQ